MGDMKDWVEDAAPLADKQLGDYDSDHSRDIQNNELLSSILHELRKLNQFMEIITGEDL